MRLLALLLLSPFLLIGRLFGFGRNNMAYLPEGHPEMAKAVSDARSSLEHFRSLLAVAPAELENFAIKVRFPVEGGSEHIWVNTLEMKGNGFVGKLANHPRNIHGMVLGSTADIAESMVTDWAYSKEGVYYGHFTTKVLLPRMPKKMRKEVMRVYGWAE